MREQRTSLPLLAASYILASSVLAQHQVFNQHQIFKVNPEVSEVSFSLGDVLHSIHGNFQVQSGSVDIDPGSLKMSGIFVVGAASGKSGNDARDKKMSKDILDAPHYKEASFAPQTYQGSISPSGNSSIQVTGVFALHSSDHDLTVPMDVTIEGKKCSVKAHFTVPYLKWGLRDPSTFLLRVSKDVEVNLTLVGSLLPVR